MSKFKILVIAIISVFLLGSGYGHSSVYSQASAGTPMCHLDKSQNAKLVSASSAIMEHALSQDPEADKYCERPDPNGDPNVGGTDSSRIGCTCVRKCNPDTGQPTENYEEGKRCKVHCKPDHCKCPNPCES